MRRIGALVRKDWIELRRNKQVLVPIVMLPFTFSIFLPGALLLMARSPEGADSFARLTDFLGSVPREQFPEAWTSEQVLVRSMAQFFFAPFFVMIPVVISTLTAATAIVGERERHTVEGLLHTPLTDREFVFAKILATWVPAVAITWVGFGAYVLVVHATIGDLFTGQFFPDTTWAVLIAGLVPLVAFGAVCAIMLISGRARTMQGAQAISGLLVLPVIVSLIFQATGVLLFDWYLVLGACVVTGIIDLVLFLLAVSRFDRERIVTQQ